MNQLIQRKDRKGFAKVAGSLRHAVSAFGQTAWRWVITAPNRGRLWPVGVADAFNHSGDALRPSCDVFGLWPMGLALTVASTIKKCA